MALPTASVQQKTPIHSVCAALSRSHMLTHDSMCVKYILALISVSAAGYVFT